MLKFFVNLLNDAENRQHFFGEAGEVLEIYVFDGQKCDVVCQVVAIEEKRVSRESLEVQRGLASVERIDDVLLRVAAELDDNVVEQGAVDGRKDSLVRLADLVDDGCDRAVFLVQRQLHGRLLLRF